MLERIRKKTKRSIRHWFITELGENTGRIHLHGICWGNPDLIKENWKYGFISGQRVQRNNSELRSEIYAQRKSNRPKVYRNYTV